MTKQLKAEKFTWINIINPTQKDISRLKQEFGFHELNLEDCLSNIQRPKVDVQSNYLFIVLHFPRYFKKLKRMMSEEIDIFLGKDFMITLHSGNLKPLTKFYEEMQRDPDTQEELTKNGSAMILYELISYLFEYCFPILDKISERLNNIDTEMFGQNASFIVPEIAKINQEIISFRKTISPERRVILDLEEKIKPFLSKGNELYFDDITDMAEKIWDNLENFKEVSESLQRSHDSYVTYKLNEGIKILTVFSAMLLPLTLITGYYGMNVKGLPLAENHFSASIILISMGLLVTLMLYFFKKKDIL
ncbi:TPA: magnesium transporter CorA [candidate division CPR2 bacterium]|uniref:Mg/Co transporter n=1 Tax=candidate division CPR2 bacterium GW2011_GWC1_41_48 TaxID=1618344 RepID=A0A0G0WAH9_UNCC2|nr:MAG: Mg/Co transporter [candidate division CPR2 bacterium GW2011_GWC2_39_35]KKR28366.1 MAG: Mg/Co transporter [candidate division CPR2 bacterium GW2011_GWD2_39_7]KKR29128.1 MAG: Mg/Co transporter [candidate division CPR2 bacterium GW2011_GWD1_39_7]KKS09082.1 MAG: Mg/Co transporter [candidate division CPR2 bacterium GW2011_GWC1_41_48]OGB62143.1 MAG: hypothetical protein A2Y27_00590 [candidate division CPR2 bacterium GWD1_39_7]OGB72558.1 MAG: hypothetical protein A2Y26_03400 [candidate divisi